MDLNLNHLLLVIAVFVPAITLHEFCHAKFADLGGDDTPRLQGRVTLNPLRHLDPIGTIMMILSNIVGVGIGWGKPVMVDSSRLKNRRVDNFILTVAGPLSNLLIALIAALVFRLAGFSVGAAQEMLIDSSMSSVDEWLSTYLYLSVMMNVGLFVFNLIPIGPLDGHWLVGELLPDKQRLAWLRFCHGPGMFLFLILVLIPRNSPLDILGRTISPAIVKLARLLFGV